MKVLLTGGAGYIGSHILIELMQKGLDILVLDNFCNSNPEVLRRIEEISGKKSIFEKVDIRSENETMNSFLDFKPDLVIHLAGLKAVEESVEFPLKYYENNVAGTINILKAMDKINCKKIIFSSTATVYGNPQYLPFDEKHDTNPINPYGETKLIVEGLIKNWVSSQINTGAIILRYFNPVAAHETGNIGEAPIGKPNNLMPIILNTIGKKNKAIEIFGNDYKTKDGTCERDYIHVVDLAKAHVLAIDYLLKFEGFEVFNIGTGRPTSVIEMIETFEKSTGVSIPYKFSSRRPGDVESSYCNSKLAQKKLHWRVSKNLEQMCIDSHRWKVQNPNGYK